MRTKIFFCILLFVIKSNFAIGQNTLISEVDSNILKFQISASGTIYAGNLNKLFIPMKEEFLLHRGNAKITQHSSLWYVDKKGKSILYDFKTGINVYPFYKKRLFPELRGYYTTSSLEGLSNKYLVGIWGASFLQRKEKHTLLLSNGLAYKYFDFMVNPSFADYRYYIIFLGLINFEKANLSLNYRYTFQYSLKTLDEYLHRVQINTMVPVTKHIRFSLIFDYAYETLIDFDKSPNKLYLKYGIIIRN